MTMREPNYVIAQKFAETVARAVGDTQLLSSTRGTMSTAHLMKSLRTNYAERLKPAFRYYNCGPELPRELGIIYCALLNHLEAVNKHYVVFRDSDLKSYRYNSNSIGAIEKHCFETAASHGIRFAEITAQRLPQLAKMNVAMRMKAEMFAELLRNDLRNNQCHLQWDITVVQLFAGRVTESTAVFEYIWRNTDLSDPTEHGPCGPCGIGELYTSDRSRQEISELLKYAFGQEASFTEDFNRVVVSK